MKCFVIAVLVGFLLIGLSQAAEDNDKEFKEYLVTFETNEKVLFEKFK